jgi:hypothetical protein
MPDLSSLARWFMLAGLVLAVMGAALWAFSRLGLPLGRLPGDFHFQIGGASCLFPLASSLLLSILLTLILNLILRRLK